MCLLLGCCVDSSTAMRNSSCCVIAGVGFLDFFPIIGEFGRPHLLWEQVIEGSNPSDRTVLVA
jgi:hypothetical protein